MSADARFAAWKRWQLAVHELATSRPLCLALTNTRQWRHAPAPLERLHTFADLLAFAEQERIVDAAQAAALGRRADQHADGTQAELDATLALRESLFRVFAAQARRAALPDGDVATLMTSFHAALAALAFDLRDGRLVPATRDGDTESEIGVVRLQCAVSAVALLSGAHARDIKECADDRGCGRLFVDVTRNRSRRYCQSSECGNRARQAAYRKRHAPLIRPSGTLSPLAGRGKG